MEHDVQIFEVSLRDGLQNEAVHLSTDDKLEHLHLLLASGVRDIEVTSFVRPTWIPALADAAEVVARLPRDAEARFWALIPNQVGLDRALSAGVDHICTFLSSSETHNRKNVNRTVRESLEGLRRVVGTAVDEGLGVRSYISTVFGCPYEGPVAVDRTVELATSLLEYGADVIVLGDTTGVAMPDQVQRVVARLVEAGVPRERLALHAHDTRGTALVNVYAAYRAGVRRFDGSVAGVGGCPYAPGAAGNAATEDLVHLFEGMGVSTGVDLEALARAGWFMEDRLGRALPGRVHQTLRPASSSACEDSATLSTRRSA